jgi:hypothetical protein
MLRLFHVSYFLIGWFLYALLSLNYNILKISAIAHLKYADLELIKKPSMLSYLKNIITFLSI